MNKVFVDYNCSVCTTYGQWISKHDKQLVIESQDMLSKKEYELDTLVFKTEGINYYYSDAVIMSIASLGGFYKLIYVLKIFPKKIRDAFYKIVSKNRHLLS
jgi:predicted DCC family thiol-disulfide oxidoreductase YuxK